MFHACFRGSMPSILAGSLGVLDMMGVLRWFCFMGGIGNWVSGLVCGRLLKREEWMMTYAERMLSSNIGGYARLKIFVELEVFQETRRMYC